MAEMSKKDVLQCFSSEAMILAVMNAIAKIAFIITRNIASLDFISAVQYMISSRSLIHSSQEHMNLQMTSS